MSQERGEADPQLPESHVAAEPAGAQKVRHVPLPQHLSMACSWHAPGMSAGPHRTLSSATGPVLVSAKTSELSCSPHA